jgi:CBS domain-containing protein
MGKVVHILQTKGDSALSVEPSRSVQEALETMFEQAVGSLLVCDRGRLLGLLTERHVAHAVAERGPSCLNGVVRDLMDGQAVYVSPESGIDECMTLMTECRTRHLPVLDDDDQVVGIVSIGDVVKALIDDKEFEIDQLQRYITGR